MENDKLIDNYIEDPSNALINDTEHKILDVLAGLKEAIVKESIDLKDKERIKLLSRIEDITKEKLDSWINSLNTITTSTEENKKKINAIDVMDKIEKYNIELEQKKQSMRVIEEKILDLNKKLNLNVEDEKKAIKEKMLEKFDIEAEIND